MSFDKFIPDDKMSIVEQNRSNFQEKYDTVLSLRDSYSNILNELTNLRDNFADFSSEQSSVSHLRLEDSDRIRYNALMKDRFLALKAIHDNTTLSREYGSNSYPFKNSLDASSSINVDFSWISKGNKVQSNYACRLAVFKICEAISKHSNNKYFRITINTLDSYNDCEITESRIYYLNKHIQSNEAKQILRNNMINIERIMDRVVINIQSAHYGLNKLLRISKQQGSTIDTLQ